MKNLFCVSLVLGMLLMVESATAQKFAGLDASPVDIEYLRTEGRGGDPIIRITYGRPQKKGRTMLGDKIPYGEVWRMGANEATEIKLYRDVTFADTKIPAGTYALYAIPGKDGWVIIFNSKLDTWGAYSYDASRDVARVTVPAEQSEREVEAFSMVLEGDNSKGTGMLYIGWENTLVKVPLKY